MVNAQEITGLLAGTIAPIAVLVFMALVLRPWNIRRKSS